MASSENNDLHFVMLPLMAPGHFIPMLDMAKLISKQKVKITIVTTPVIASKFALTVNHAQKSGLSLNVLTLPFPTEEVGLPKGCESLDLLPSDEFLRNFFMGVHMLQNSFEQLFKSLKPTPSCIICDKYLVWGSDSAEKLQVPRIMFDGTCGLTTLSEHTLVSSKAHEDVKLWDNLVLPDLPNRIEMPRAHLPELYRYSNRNEHNEYAEKSRKAMDQAFGIVINTFDELESQFINELKKVRNDRVWCVGPLSLCNEDSLDKSKRDNEAAINKSHCLKWLDEKEPGSVVYVCLGTLGRLSVAQLAELGLGLEASKAPFVWVVKGGDKNKDIDKWIDENGIEERTRGRGLIIRGWAPQVLILSHPSVGAFLTHCGWNSTLEGICAGIPLITWPADADQFFDEKLVVEVLKIGVSVGNQRVISIKEEDQSFKELVKREKVLECVEKVMDDEGVEGRERRERAKLLAEKARGAMEEGGSTSLSVASLIENVKQFISSKSS